jgi:hypothetical protein
MTGNDNPLGPQVAVIDSVYNSRMRDVVGNKSDADSIAITASLIALARHIISMAGGSGAEITAILADTDELQLAVEKIEETQTGSEDLGAIDNWVTLFEYTSTDYQVYGDLSINFPISQTYQVEITTDDVTDGPEPYADPVIDATNTKRTYQVLPTQYLKVRARCRTAISQTVEWRRKLKFRLHSGATAPV